MTLASYLELEDAIAEDPFDEARWIVLEDWLLERGDPRAQLVILEKQGADTREALRKLAPQLLGADHELLETRLYQCDWRAGFLRECQYTGGPDHLVEFLDAPASGLLRAFTVTADPEVIDRTTGAFVGRPCVQSLQRLTLSSWNHAGSDVRIACGGLGEMTQLRHLVLRTVMMHEPPMLPRLRELTLAPMRTAVYALVGQLARTPWPTITDLTYEVPELLGAELGPTALLALVSAETFPRLERLGVTGLPLHERELTIRTLSEACAKLNIALTLD